jgi:integration host factor subunit alpha
MTLTKAHITDSICKKTGYTKQRSAELFNSFLAIIKQRLESDEGTLISGFGKFCLSKKKERRGRNPQTGEDLMLESRRIVTFKCSGRLRDKINGTS